MTDNNPREGGSKQHRVDRDRLDRELDAALGNYAAAEPRAGIEERILANLRAARKEASVRSWWGWPAMGTLAAVVVAGVLLAVRFGQQATNRTIPNGDGRLLAVTRPAGSQAAENNRLGGDASPAAGKTAMRGADPHLRPRIRLHLHPHSGENESVAAPKLDVFPSPQPLSEQERMLAAYVAQHRRQAVLIARARMAELKEDLAMEKEIDEENSAPGRQPSDQSITR